MSARDISDKAAIAAGLVTGVALACVGAEFTVATLAGVVVAALIDAPFGSITHAEHQGTVHRPHVQRVRRPPHPRNHTLKPTGYPRGAFARL